MTLTSSKTPDLDLRSSNSGTENRTPRKPAPGLLKVTFCKRSGSRKGRERNKTAFTMLKMAALAPMPRARVSTTTTVNRGDLRRTRRANFMSWRTVCIMRSSGCQRHSSRAASRASTRQERKIFPAEAWNVQAESFLPFPVLTCDHFQTSKHTTQCIVQSHIGAEAQVRRLAPAETAASLDEDKFPP